MSLKESTPYTGPSAAHMLATRTFASYVIANHGTNDAILDDTELSLLREFVEDPSKKGEILLKHHMLDDTGKKLNNKGSLTALVIARYGSSESAMSEGDVEKLKGWFRGENGGI